MTEKQAQRYFEKNARFYEHTPFGPFYAILMPNGKHLRDRDVAVLAEKFYIAVGVKKEALHA